MRVLLVAFLMLLPFKAFCENKVVLVTGSSKGIGKAICEQLADKGEIVYGTMRSPDAFDGFKNEKIKVKELDVTKPQQIESIISEIVSEQGRIDVVINNAGYLLLGPCELTDLDQVKSQFDTNFFGSLSVIQAVLPQMRAQSSGHIINMSSTSGFDPIGGFDIYSASKYALEGLTGSMAGYLNQFGINISLIEPGPVKTEITSGMEQGRRVLEDNPYEKFQKNLVSWFQGKIKLSQNPQEVAELVEKVVSQESPKLRYQTNLNGVKRAQNNLVDITGCSTRATKQAFTSELFEQGVNGAL
ncbi:MAG: 3-phenylpropionate-dihydrodiol/cinnamic acid-dihydrodiol dehydrogenase [Chlamydiae bacterium]|nr:3-phenylpropionate-dihydrodiol/cinnamic acid-dihydrodiol dehydrogenase [Chlamydiota bacterium]